MNTGLFYSLHNNFVFIEMESQYSSKIVISESFKSQLITGILTCPIIYIPHYHYNYVDVALEELIPQEGDNSQSFYGINRSMIYEHDIKRGRIEFDTKISMRKDNDFEDVLVELANRSTMSSTGHTILGNCKIFLFKNVALPQEEHFSSQSLSDPTIQSLLQIFVEKYERGLFDKMMTIIIVSPISVYELPQSLKNILTVLEIPTPTVAELNEYVSQFVTDSNDTRQMRAKDDMVRTLQGLQMYDVIQTLRTSLILKNGRIGDAAVRLALAEKKRIVKKTGIIEVVDTDTSFEDIGGLKRLVKDLKTNSKIYSNLGDAEKYHIPIPKGILIIGMPGCGKSMIAKATANEFGVSLLRLDVSRLMGKYVGESEENLRRALATAEAAHPCVLWIDEIEKAFAGTNNVGGDNDMLVMRMMGHFLTWMQERKSPVYIIATANDVMRPEFMRKGRFDEVYFVDFPDKEERAQILQTKIAKKYPHNNIETLFDFSEIGDCKKVVENMKGKYGGFSGSEIESVLNIVVAEKFLQYLSDKEKNNYSNSQSSKIRITKVDFDKVIERVKDSVMANQESRRSDREDMLRDKTAIERIIDMEKTYKFVNAKG